MQSSSPSVLKSGITYTALFGAVVAALYTVTPLIEHAGGFVIVGRVLVVNFVQIALACWITLAWLNRTAGAESLWRQIGRAAWVAAIASLIASPVGLLETAPAHWTWPMWLGKALNCWGFSFGLAIIDRVERLNRAQACAISGAQTQRLSRDRSDLALRLAALQSQIEPHFIYNTLGNVRALVLTSPEKADALLAQLIAYLRAAVPSMRTAWCTVGQELDFASAYLAVMQVRLGGRLRVKVEADPATRGLRCAPGLVMGLVENAIKHGIDPMPEGGEVCVSASQHDGLWVLEVRDTGAGLAAGEGSGVGLTNLLERLALLYDGRARFDLTSNLPRGAIARITIPLDALATAHADRPAA